jgi:hypothetical protein
MRVGVGGAATSSSAKGARRRQRWVWDRSAGSVFAAGDVRRRHHLRLKVRGAAARVRVPRPGARGRFLEVGKDPGSSRTQEPSRSWN